MVYLFLGDGFEEAEALCTVDVLRRCDVDVTTVSVMKGEKVTGAHGISVIADVVIDSVADDGEMYICWLGEEAEDDIMNGYRLLVLYN